MALVTSFVALVTPLVTLRRHWSPSYATGDPRDAIRGPRDVTGDPRDITRHPRDVALTSRGYNDAAQPGDGRLRAVL